MKFIEKLKNIPTRTYLFWLTGIIIGGVAGYIYYIKVGCVTGTCSITSNPYLSILWGALIGYFIADLFVGKNAVRKKVAEGQDED
jgi:hypothetical protein